MRWLPLLRRITGFRLSFTEFRGKGTFLVASSQPLAMPPHLTIMPSWEAVFFRDRLSKRSLVIDDYNESLNLSQESARAFDKTC
ncbi:hypothetical protein AOLI_G00318300 [Acnodon oligacanthus]